MASPDKAAQETTLPIKTRQERQKNVQIASGRASPIDEGEQSVRSSTSGVSLFGEASSRRSGHSRTEDNLLYKVRSIVESSDDSDSNSDKASDESSKGANEERRLSPLRPTPPKTGAPQQGRQLVRRLSRSGAAGVMGSAVAGGLSIDVCSKNALEPAAADAADGWDRPGPAPRMRTMSGQQGAELQRAWAIEKVAKMTEALCERISQHAKQKLVRRQRRFKTAPSSVATPLSCSSPTSTLEPLKPVVIFDWDDTLFPTWFVTEVVQSSTPAESKYSRLPEDSPYWESLAAHAQLVSETLTMAASFGSVAIVTLAARPWVDNSAEWFLPGLDLPEVLLNLDIPVFYAREHVRKREKAAARVEEGVDLFMIAKRNAMKTCLRKLCPTAERFGNVVCIGDSTTEETAIKDILWSDDAGEAMCKTIKLLDDPTLEVLGMELQLVSSWFEKMIPHEGDFHICLNDAGSKLVWE